MMKTLLYSVLILAVPVICSANWAETDTTGRTLSSGYGIGTIDHYSGTVSLNHNDYTMVLGPGSAFPLNRRTLIEANAQFNTPDFTDYNLGQLAILSVGGVPLSHGLCRYERIAIRGLNGESVVFSRHSRALGNANTLISKNNWKLECLNQQNEFSAKVSTPAGLIFYYDNQYNNAVSVGGGGHLPSRIEDANGNAITFEKSGDALILTSSYQTVRLDRSGIQIDGTAYHVARFNAISGGYRVTYIEDRMGANVSSWTVQRLTNLRTRVCSPLGACATYNIQREIYAGWESFRLQEVRYDIPHQGEYILNYSYEYNGSRKTLTTMVQHPDHLRTYEYRHDNSHHFGSNWMNGALLRERLMTPDGSNYYEEVTYEYSPSRSLQPEHEARVQVVPLLSKKTTKRRTNATSTGAFRSLGVVEELHEDYDNWHRLGKVTYHYPQGSGNLFPSITYRTEWADIADVHRLDQIEKTWVEGQSYFNQYSYDRRGNLTAHNSNGLTTRYTYDSKGHLTSKTDPEGNRFNYSQFSFGIPKRETGPEGYELTREVEHGFVTSETLYGDRTTRYEYNLLGTLLKVTYAENNRAPVEYHYSIPGSGGMVRVKTIGSFIERTYYNGMGLPYLVETLGDGSGSGESYHYKQVFEYDFNGNLIVESVPVEASITITNQHRTRYHQDPSGRRFLMDAADGNRIEFIYNSPFRTEMKDQAGVRTIEHYRPFAGFGSEKLARRIHPRGNSRPSDQVELEIHYNDSGWIHWAAVGKHEHVYTYNDEGFVKEVSTPETGPVRYEYNRNGQVTRMQMNSDSPVYYDYDGLGRLTRERYSDSSLDIIYSYNEPARQTRLVKVLSDNQDENHATIKMRKL